MPQVVAPMPGLFIDGNLPLPGLGAEVLGAIELVVATVEDGVPELGGLKLLVHPQRQHSGGPSNGLEREVQQHSACHFQGVREGVERPDATHILVPHAGFGPAAHVVKGRGQAGQALGFGEIMCRQGYSHLASIRSA